MKKLFIALFLLMIFSLSSQQIMGEHIEIDANGNVNIDGNITANTGACSQVTTATLYVSPDGDGTDGKNWNTAYTALSDALDACSTDANDLTAIILAPHATFYDIDTTGDPTWSANVSIMGANRRWSILKNTHASATSILKLTGKVQLTNLAFKHDDITGLVLTQSSFNIQRCSFNSTASTQACKAIDFDGSAATIFNAGLNDVRIRGHVTYTTALYLNQVSFVSFNNLDIHMCLNAIQIIDTDSDNNFFYNSDIGGCAIGLNLDAGNSQHLFNVNFHENTLNIDDEVGDSHFIGITGEFDMDTIPDDLTGVSVAGGDAGVWGTDTEVRAAASATKPFKIVGYIFEPGVTQKHKIRFTADDGVTYFDEVFVEQTKNSGSDAGSDTDFIFNVGTQIKASVKAESGGGDTVNIWLKIQEI